jgi:hypothetical protein
MLPQNLRTVNMAMLYERERHLQVIVKSETKKILKQLADEHDCTLSKFANQILEEYINKNYPHLVKTKQPILRKPLPTRFENFSTNARV